MITLRRALERGRRHPVLGPIVVVLLAILLVLVVLHAAHEGWDGAAELGIACVVIATLMGVVVSCCLRCTAPLRLLGTCLRRGPPARHAGSSVAAPLWAAELVLPLRR